MPAELLVLRLVHILCGTFWVGSGVFTAFFLTPALAAPGVDAMKVFASLANRRLFVVLPVSALLTIGSGARLMSIASAAAGGSYFASASGKTFAASGACAVLAFVLSLLLGRPLFARAAQLVTSAAGKPEGERAEVMRRAAQLRQRGAIASTIAVTLLVLAAAGMSVARYVA